MAESHLNTSDENWKDITGFPGYQVSDQGRVRSFWKRVFPGYGGGSKVVLDSYPQRVLRSHWNGPKTSLNVSLSGGDRRVFAVCRLVLEAFVGPCPPGMESCHGDGKADNCFLTNLRWDTRKANMQDSVRHGTHPGLGHHPAKLTEKQVLQIRELYATKKHTMRGLGEMFGVVNSTIRDIVHRKKWKHI